MGYSLCVAAAALALATAPLTRAQDARPISPVEVAVNTPRYDPEIPDRRIPLHVPREAPKPEYLVQPTVHEISAAERYAIGMQSLQVPWDGTWAGETTPIRAHPRADSEGPLPYAGHAASLSDLFYLPFDDGTYDTENPVYDRDLGRAQDWVRRYVTGPVREGWRESTSREHRSPTGSRTRESLEPYFSSGMGIQWSKVWEDANYHRRKSRVRFKDLREWELGYFYERNTWRFAATVGMDDGKPEVHVGVRIRPGENTSLERMAKRHRYDRSDSVHHLRTEIAQEPVTPTYLPTRDVPRVVARSSIGR